MTFASSSAASLVVTAGMGYLVTEGDLPPVFCFFIRLAIRAGNPT
jgi:hypothetical protein